MRAEIVRREMGKRMISGSVRGSLIFEKSFKKKAISDSEGSYTEQQIYKPKTADKSLSQASLFAPSQPLVNPSKARRVGSAR